MPPRPSGRQKRITVTLFNSNKLSRGSNSSIIQIWWSMPLLPIAKKRMCWTWRPRSTWLHGKHAAAFGRSARERHHGPRWEQKNAAQCCQQTARHTTSSYRASWINAQIAALLGSYDAAKLTVCKSTVSTQDESLQHINHLNT